MSQRVATVDDWIAWRPAFDSTSERVGQVVQILEPVAKGPGGGSGYLVRALTADGLTGTPWRVYRFEVTRVGLSPLEILARS